MNKFILTAFFAVLLLFPAETFACACCAESGEYSIRMSKPADYEIDVISGMKFDENAYLFMTEAGFELIKGLDEINKDFNNETWVATAGEFGLNTTFAAKTWKFTFKTKSGKTGILTLPMPTQMLSYKVDIHDGKTFGAGGPKLYKELRFKGNVQSGTGFFRTGIVKPTTYFLVFQGRGNGCDNTEDYSYWRLEINGKKADYALFGELSSGRNDDDEDEEETEVTTAK